MFPDGQLLRRGQPRGAARGLRRRPRVARPRRLRRHGSLRPLVMTNDESAQTDRQTDSQLTPLCHSVISISYKCSNAWTKYGGRLELSYVQNISDSAVSQCALSSSFNISRIENECIGENSFHAGTYSCTHSMLHII